MNFDEPASKSISDIFSIGRAVLKRYWRLSLAPAVSVMLLLIILSLRLPDYYSADVVIVGQPRKINTGVLKATERGEQEERMDLMLQELLTRANFRSIIETYNLYPENQGLAGREYALKRLHDSIHVTNAVSASGKPLLNTFRVTFKHSDPKTTFDVTNKLSNLFIEGSRISQSTETQGTVEFLDSQLRTARKNLEQTESAVQDFVRKNVGKLPEHKDQALVRLQNMQAQLSTNSQMIATNTARLGYLQRELKLTTAETAMSGSDQGGGASPEDSLAQMERYLVVLRSRYSDSYPDVINTKKRIEALKSRIASGGTGGARYSGGSSESRQIRREISELEVQTQAMRGESENLKKQIDQLNADIKDMPVKEQELTKIMRDYNNVKDNYAKLLAAKEEAEIQSSLVKSQKNAQFRIVDPPSMPIKPSGPNRLAVSTMGFAASVAVFFALPFMLYLFNSAYKFRDDLEEDLGIKVMGVVPPMDTPTVRAGFRKAGLTSVLASAAVFCVGALLIVMIV